MEKVMTTRNNNANFVDGNKTYTLIDMGSYIGHKQRNFYDRVPEIWKLMDYSETLNDGNTVSISALVDDLGFYIKLMVDMGNASRILILKGNFVMQDYVVVRQDEDDMFGKEYVAFDSRGNIVLMEPVEEYLKQSCTFVSEDGDRIEPGVFNNDIIIHFLEMGKDPMQFFKQTQK